MAWGAVGGRTGLLGEGMRCVRIIGNIEKNEFRMQAESLKKSENFS